MTEPIRVAVIGVGYFGRFHARQVAANPRARLVAIVDQNEARAKEVADQYGCQALSDYSALIGQIDAATIAVPTPMHFPVAEHLLNAGIDVLIEKPMTDIVERATRLIEIADLKGRVLQVGHIERYSATFKALSKMVERPQYLEGYRIAPWRERGVDVDVIFDLMIHDIDIILGLVRAPVVSVHAVGTPVFSEKADLANARLAFASGAVANITASRVSHKTERKLRIFQPKSYLVCDFGESRIFTYSQRGDLATEGIAAVANKIVTVEKEDSLANEISEFLTCIAERKRPSVDGIAGREAVRIASLISDSIAEYRRTVTAAG